MILKVTMPEGGQYMVDWHWAHDSGDWWVEIEEIDNAPAEDEGLTEAEIEHIRVACANDYSLAEYQSDEASDPDR